MNTDQPIQEMFQINENIELDDYLEQITIDDIPCSKSDIAQLNESASSLRFQYDGSKLYRLSSPQTGFLVKVAFRCSDRNLPLTLSSNFFQHMFKSFRLSLKDKEIERVNFPYIVSDILYHLEDDDFRNHSGESFTFIPDTSKNPDINLCNTTTFLATAVGNAEGIVNTISNKSLSINPNFNAGLKRRCDLLNYVVGDNTTNRYFTFFIPLYRIFSFCELNKLLKYVPFEIDITREDLTKRQRVIYGSEGDIEFGNGANNCGLNKISLRLEIIHPRADLMSSLESDFNKKTLKYSYLKRSCEEVLISSSQTFCWRKYCSVNSDGTPRFLFVVFKPSEIANTTAINYQKFIQANIKNITVNFRGNSYPYRNQLGNFDENNFASFYNDFISVGKSMGKENIALSMKDFRDLFTIYSFDLTSQSFNNNALNLSVDIERESVPANDNNYTNPKNILCYIVILSSMGISIQPRTCEIQLF